MAKLQFLNGRRFSYCSLEITLFKKNVNVSEIFIDIDSLDYGDQLNMEFVRGTNRGPIGITAGDYEADDTNFSMGKSTFTKGIVEGIGEGWLGSELGITIAYNDDGEPLCTDRIRCFIAGGKDAPTSGPEGLKVKVPLKTLWISRQNIMPIKGLLR